MEVYPKERLSHRDEMGVAYFGPHQHIGERYESLLGLDNLTCADLEKWVREFLKRANISFTGKYEPPEQAAGQLDLGI